MHQDSGVSSHYALIHLFDVSLVSLTSGSALFGRLSIFLQVSRQNDVFVDLIVLLDPDGAKIWSLDGRETPSAIWQNVTLDTT